jgi:hypothetical protein
MNYHIFSNLIHTQFFGDFLNGEKKVKVGKMAEEVGSE